MKRTLEKMILLTLLFFTVNGYSQQRSNSIYDTSGHPHICPDFRLQADQIFDFHEWLRENEVVPKKAIDLMKYVVSEDGTRTPRHRPYYPIFISWDGIDIETGELWNPFKEGFPNTLPRNVDWAANCGSR